MTGRSKRSGAAVLLILLILAAYAPAFRAGYIIDDDNYVTSNRALRDVAGLKRIWLDVRATPQYYPLAFTAFWIEYHLWELSPAGYHGVNVALHIFNALILWMLLARLRIPGAWFAAALFGLHPVHVESVAWIAELKNVLSTAFYLLAALVYVRYAGLEDPQRPVKRSPRLYALSLVLFAAALLSKSAVVSLPAALLLVTWFKLGRIRWPKDVMPLVPMFAIGLAVALVTLRVEATTGGARGALWDLSGLQRVFLAGRALWFYGGKLLWPMNLSFNYERWVIDASVWRQGYFVLAAFALVAGLWFARGRLGRGPLVAVLFFAGTLAPTLGFFNVYWFRYSFVADHFQYVASISLIALAAGGAAGWASTLTLPRARAALGAACLVLAMLGVLTWNRCRIFKDLETLCLDVLAGNPASWIANNNLGNIYMKRRDLDKALEHLGIALESSPDYIETHLNLSITLMNLGRFDEAQKHARRAMEISPQNMLGYSTMGDVFLRARRPQDAIEWYREALKRDPSYAKARSGLATALSQTGRNEEAVKEFNAALETDPMNAAVQANLAIALANLGRYDEAIRHFEKALHLDPGNATLIRYLALARGKSQGKP